MEKILKSFSRSFSQKLRGLQCQMRNVEIKAKVRDPKALKEIVEELTDCPMEIIKQHDTFYNNVREGRLKLRKFEPGNGELIFYNRPDMEGPKASLYGKCDLTADNIDDLHEVLECALGTNGIVKKVRELYWIGQTRVHLDTVEELGDFMELEVVLKDEQTLEEGEEIVTCLMEQLGIEKSDLLSGAYRDFLQKKKEAK